VTGVRGEEKLILATDCRVIAGILRKKYPRLFELHASLSLIICERYHLYRYRRDVTKMWQDSTKNRAGLAESSADSVRGREDSVRGREDSVRDSGNSVRGRENSVRGREDSVRGREDSIKRTASSVIEETVVEDSVRIMTDSGKHEAAPPTIIVLPEARSTETETRIEKEVYLANKRKYHASATQEELQREQLSLNGQAGDSSEDVHRIIHARIRYGKQCCGSGMFIPDPNIFPSRIRIKEFKCFNPKKLCSRKYDPGCSFRIRKLIFYPCRIPDPRVKKAPDPDPQH
jgi:hypothetical protein